MWGRAEAESDFRPSFPRPVALRSLSSMASGDLSAFNRVLLGLFDSTDRHRFSLRTPKALLGVCGLQESGALALSSFEAGNGGSVYCVLGSASPSARRRATKKTLSPGDFVEEGRDNVESFASAPLLSSLPEAVEELRTVGLAFYRPRCVSEALTGVFFDA